jgi:hypothetical protein
MTRFRFDVRRGALTTSLCGVAVVVGSLAVPGLPAAGGRLVDGSSAPPVPKELRALGPRAVMTKRTTRPLDRIRERMLECPEARLARGSARAVERIGLHGRSVTFVVGRRHLVACDRDPQARPMRGPWCGVAAWETESGRVADPRLSLCYGTRGRAVAGFAWVNPVRRARWVVVDQPRYREVYATGAGLPVRVETVSGLERAGSAVFHVTELDGRGVMLVRREVVAEIAG